MAVVTKPISSRKHTITAADNGLFLELGPGATAQSVGVFTLQFNPDTDYDGSVVVMGRVFGPAAADANVPPLPISYRALTVNNVAADFSVVSAAAITGPTMIQVPSNGVSIGLLVAVTAGSCTLVSWDLQGSSSI